MLAAKACTHLDERKSRKFPRYFGRRGRGLKIADKRKYARRTHPKKRRQMRSIMKDNHVSRGIGRHLRALRE